MCFKYMWKRGSEENKINLTVIIFHNKATKHITKKKLKEKKNNDNNETNKFQKTVSPKPNGSPLHNSIMVAIIVYVSNGSLRWRRSVALPSNSFVISRDVTQNNVIVYVIVYIFPTKTRRAEGAFAGL